MNRVPPKNSSDSFWLTQAKFENIKTTDPIVVELDAIIIGTQIEAITSWIFSIISIQINEKSNEIRFLIYSNGVM